MLAADTHPALTPEDFDRLAAMHVQCLPGSIVAFLGPRYCSRFYRYLANSTAEHLFVERHHGVVVGACTLSVSAPTLTRRLLTGTPLLLYLPGALMRRARSDPMGASDSRSRPTRRHATVPEVVWLFTAPSQRRRGVASRLLRRVEAFLTERGVPRYAVVTGSDDPATAAFYEKEGFVMEGSVARWGRSLRLLVRTHGRTASNS